MDEPIEKFEMWARVNLFGHTTRVGKLSVMNTGVEVLYRLDIPTPEGFNTKFFGKGAIYSIDPMTEAAARFLVERMGPPAPVSEWDLPTAWQEAIRVAKAKALLARTEEDEEASIRDADDVEYRRDRVDDDDDEEDNDEPVI